MKRILEFIWFWLFPSGDSEQELENIIRFILLVGFIMGVGFSIFIFIIVPKLVSICCQESFTQLLSHCYY